MVTKQIGIKWLLGLSLCLVGCGEPADVAVCDPGAGAPVRMVQIVPLLDQMKSEGGNLLVPIEVTAQAPCLRGGLHANLRTSVGALESSKPGGDPLFLFLGPQGADVLTDKVSGRTTLTIPPARIARIDVEIGEATAAITVGPLSP